MQLFAFLAAILNVKFEKYAVYQFLHVTAIVIGSVLPKIVEVYLSLDNDML